jgi:hypothetical protein
MGHTDTDVMDHLIQVGVGSDEEIAGLVEDVGLTSVAATLMEEVIFRCAEPANTVPMNVGLCVTHEDERWQSVFRLVRDEPVQLVDADEPALHMQLEMSATDLIRRLFGRSRDRRTGDFGNTFLPLPSKSLYDLVPASQATNIVVSACSTSAPDLGDLAVRYGSDKWASLHWYTPHYERHFAPFRDEPVRVLEIGIGGYGHALGGASLKMWKRYFHRGTVFGLDVYDKSGLDQPRLTTIIGDQNSPDDLVAIHAKHGPFDIVIDDGSHVAEHIHTSFQTLFPYLRDGGVYVIEDLQTAYLTEFGGNSGDTAEPKTSVGLVKHLLDDLHHQEHQHARDGQPSVVQRSITGLHVYHNIAFIEKGTNAEEGFPGWLLAVVAGDLK